MVGPDHDPAVCTASRLVLDWAAAGLYVPSFEPARRGHQLTRKIRRSKVSREHDAEFAQLLAALVARCFPGFEPDLVASIPAKPGQEDRFRNIRRGVAARTGATDAPAALAQTRVIEDYRQMTIAQRLAVAGGRFTASDSLRGKSVLLIDDVLTSGAQAADASRALKEAGAVALRFVAVARATGGPAEHEGGCPSPAAASENNRLRKRVSYDQPMTELAVVEVIAVEPLPLGASGSRRAIVRWSDGSVGEALRWWDDEVLFCEGDLLGKTQAQLRGLHFSRDRLYLRSDSD